MVISSRGTVIAAVAAAAVFAPGADAFAPGFLAPMSGMPRALSHPARAQAPATGPRMVAAPERDPATWFSPGQFVGPQAPGQDAGMELPYDNFKLDKNKPEAIKKDSGHLRFPLLQEMADKETIQLTDQSVVVLKHHGSYQQQNRDLQRTDKAGYADSFQFMLRLKNPCGKMTPEAYKALDDCATKYGQQDLRATTRMAWQIHGVKKKDLKQVIANIANAGGSTLGGCGDINRNVMTPPVPLADPAYQHAYQAANFIGELFKPTSNAFAELWLDGKQASTVEYFRKDLVEGTTGVNHIPPLATSLEELDTRINAAMVHDNGNGIITGDPDEPLYGRTYLPRKFKIAVTVPGDNSMDVYIHDISLVVIMAEDGKTLMGYNVMVGGGMGRTHNKESTFARVADHLGYVDKQDITECLKAILAAQRDHGNREVRANARLKYLVHTLGVDKFRKLTESYMGSKMKPWVPLPEWKNVDWLGWHEQGDDANMFLGIHVPQGRVKDYDGIKYRTAIRAIVDKFDCDTRLTANQNVVFCGIKKADMAEVDAILRLNGVKPIQEVDMMTRQSIACPSFPLCGLAQAEAERRMPDFNARMNVLLSKMGMPGEYFVHRMTGCPNGCARPYMAELAWVGQGPDLYQMWLGGSHNLDGRTGWQYKDKVKQSDMETEVEPILYMWKSQRLSNADRLGDFLDRMGKDKIKEFCAAYVPGTAFKAPTVEPGPSLGELLAMSNDKALSGKSVRLTTGPRKQQVRVSDELHTMLKDVSEKNKEAISDLVERLLVKGLV